MNYGHPLEFGVSITPASDGPERAVDLAVRSEDLGYDLVTFQDHPYQPELLDAWTLLSWVAGRTQRVTLSANVLNLPLREPAILARSASSLDLLSGGRLALALGAGHDWNAIAAMSGPKVTAPEAVDALDEAIDVIRGLLDVDGDRPLRFEGERYRLPGAQRGPIPAHDIPIWVGARKPRMLRLIGRKADGWVLSPEDALLEQLREGNAIIDRAAHEAGRDPREIRRLVNISGQFAPSRSGFLHGPSDSWVADLAPMVVEEGVGTFILASDDPTTIEQFAREVVPGLREAVDNALPHGFSRPVRSTRVRARRREGIAYDDIPVSLADAAVEPGDPGYAHVRSTYFRPGAPGVVFQANNTEQVVEALAFARAHPRVPLSIRSGGHGMSGRSTNDGGIVIDLSRLNWIEVLDPVNRLVRIEPGARWSEVAAALAPYGWALSSGDAGSVGVGGLATAGGIGFLAREHGLTIDHMTAAEVVLADGSLVRASEAENPDLFWAIRGAGANFGIVTAFEFQVYDVGKVGWAQLVFDAGDTASFLERWGAAQEAAPRDVTAQLIVTPPRAGQPVLAIVLAMVDSDAPQTIISRLQPFADIAPLYDQQVVITTYAAVMASMHLGEHFAHGETHSRTALAHHLTPELAREAARLIRDPNVYWFQIRPVGGAVADVPADATAYANRSANFSILVMGASRLRLDEAWDRLAHHFDGLYLNFESDLRPERLRDAFPPATLERLRALKARYDPNNVFRDNFNIAPRRASQSDPVAAAAHPTGS